MSTRSASTSDFPVSSPIALKNVHAIAPPITAGRPCGSSCSMTSILPGDLRAAEDRRRTAASDSRAPRRGSRAPSASASPATAGLQAVRDAFGRRVRAVRRPERVVHVEVAELGEPAATAARRSSLRRRGSACSRAATTRALGSCVAFIGFVGVGALDEARSCCFGSSSPSRRATGSSEYFASGLPFGRPRCDSSTTRAPRSSSAWIVGSAARMRVSSVTRPLSSGTLKSTRTSARLPSHFVRRRDRGSSSCSCAHHALSARRRTGADRRSATRSPTRCRTSPRP